MITGIVIALPEELSTLTSKKIDKGCYVFVTDAIVLAYSGAGADNARAASEALIAQGATKLISWGCAAALCETLKPGDLVLTDTLIDTELTEISIHPEWHGHAQNLLSAHLQIHTGSLVESKGIVATGTDKKHLHAHTGAVALDMESAAIAKVARKNNLPFLAIRAIADPADMDLPKAVNHALNDEGEIILSKLLLFIVLHPSELPELIKLGLHFNAAKNTLKLIAKQLNHLTALPSQDQ
ncbi:MAG: phosphorylase [Methylobacter sp.]|nr:phosphorylase [Methylobacter sp.]